MSKSRKQTIPKAIEEADDEIDNTEENEDIESVYDEVDDEIDIQEEFDEDETKKVKDDEEDEEEEDDEDDEVSEVSVPKKRMHVYHQIQDSTEIKIVPPEKRVTSEYMTIYEYAMIVGTRATHIAEGSILYTSPNGLYDPRDIAKKEIAENKCPLSITRQVSPTMIEVWEVNEMIKPQM